MKLLDDQLVEWVVKGGDPAKKAVSALVAKGFDTIVLPRRVYLKGIGGPKIPLPPLVEPSDKALPFIMRLRDCIVVLGMETEDGKVQS